MTDYTTEKIGCGFVTFLIVCGIFVVGLVGGLIFTKSDVLVKETPEYLYYKQYDLYNTDSTIRVFHKPIYYDGVVTNIEYYHHMVGLIGKGGHWNTQFIVKISYDNKIYTYKDDVFGHKDTYKYNVGDKVKVVETFYPDYEFKFYK